LMEKVLIVFSHFFSVAWIFVHISDFRCSHLCIEFVSASCARVIWSIVCVVITFKER
jgi:hypothetical protein